MTTRAEAALCSHIISQRQPPQAQTTPQAPKLVGSVRRLMQRPLQSVWPPGQRHVFLTHLAPPRHLYFAPLFFLHF